MRKVGLLLSVFVILGLAAPPAFAQAPAAAPAPKVTITGLVDFVTSVSKNWSGQGAGAGNDVTDGGKDKMWYSRERGVFNIIGEVGRSKGVWAVELDFVNGAGATNTGTTASGNSANFDLDTDVPGFVETKWLYVETPITGPGSLLPFIPLSSIIRAGGQPARGHDYKTGIQWAGDFPGVTIETTYAPNLRSTLTYAQIGEKLDRVVTPGGQNEDWAFLASVEFDVFKGFTVKPTYTYVSLDGGSCGSAALSSQRKNGFDYNNCTSSNNMDTTRHTIGGDIRWTSGPFTLQPTFLYQFGDQQIKPGQGGVPANQRARDVDIKAWIADVIAGFRTGPLNIQLRGIYTPGMKARHLVQNGADVGYYQAINSGFGYFGGWTEIWTGGIEYNTAMLVGSGGVVMRESPSYDKYGRAVLALALDYALTPALSFNGLVSSQWTAEKVDTNGVLSATGMSNADGRGDDRWLGVETNAGMTYRFAPNVQFDLVGAILWAQDALNHARVAGGPVKDADNVYKAVARIRFTF
jgi:hypothetical protein